MCPNRYRTVKRCWRDRINCASKELLQIIDENDTKLVLKACSEPTVEMKLEDEGTVISIDIIEPECVGSIVQ
ncbi:MAG: hypothetical protein ACXVI1_12245 [Halobacteriota archaeon]